DGADDVAAGNGAAWHAIDDAGSKILSNGEAAGLFYGARAFSAIVTHAGHENGDGLRAAFLGDGAEKHVGGRAVAIHARRIGNDGDETIGRVSREQMAIARANESASSEELITGVSFMNFDQGTFVETLGQHFGEARGHVLGNEQAAG